MNIFPEQTAYIIYTSGSTGKPKGVEIRHQTIANHTRDMLKYYQLSPKDNVLQFAALNFDASIEQILPTLISGATLCMRENELWDTANFHQKIKDFELTVINLPTAYWVQLTEEWAKNPQIIPDSAVRLVIVGGDLFPASALDRWKRLPLRNVRLLNAYGPTETTITATTFEIPPNYHGQRVPIGRPCANRRLYVVDAYGNLTPVGLPGELYIGGDALAKGYLHRPELTARQFIPNPFDSEGDARCYRTGDRVRFLPDGNLEFLGRIDFQVKIRGFRIELSEIENVIESHPEIKESAVAVFEAQTGDKRLVAYFVCQKPQAVTVDSLKKFLKAKLPDYMIPSVFMELDALPMDASGKIDRKSLPKPDLSRAGLQVDYVAPRTPTEETLAEIVKEVLNVDKVGIKDNFFELGGHSMLATQAISRIREQFGVEVSLRSIFENPTVEGLAKAIVEAQAQGVEDTELEQMLDQLENLSEEEINKLLSEDE